MGNEEWKMKNGITGEWKMRQRDPDLYNLCQMEPGILSPPSNTMSGSDSSSSSCVSLYILEIMM